MYYGVGSENELCTYYKASAGILSYIYRRPSLSYANNGDAGTSFAWGRGKILFTSIYSRTDFCLIISKISNLLNWLKICKMLRQLKLFILLHFMRKVVFQVKITKREINCNTMFIILFTQNYNNKCKFKFKIAIIRVFPTNYRRAACSFLWKRPAIKSKTKLQRFSPRV